MAKDYRLEKRKFVIGGIALTIVLIYLIRLFVLQITTDDYKKNAEQATRGPYYSSAKRQNPNATTY